MIEEYQEALYKAEIAFTQIAYDGTPELVEILARLKYDVGYRGDRMRALKEIARDAIKDIQELRNKERPNTKLGKLSSSA